MKSIAKHKNNNNNNGVSNIQPCEYIDTLTNFTQCAKRKVLQDKAKKKWERGKGSHPVREKVEEYEKWVKSLWKKSGIGAFLAFLRIFVLLLESIITAVL